MKGFWAEIAPIKKLLPTRMVILMEEAIPIIDDFPPDKDIREHLQLNVEQAKMKTMFQNELNMAYKAQEKVKLDNVWQVSGWSEEVFYKFIDKNQYPDAHLYIRHLFIKSDPIKDNIGLVQLAREQYLRMLTEDFTVEEVEEEDELVDESIDKLPKETKKKVKKRKESRPNLPRIVDRMIEIELKTYTSEDDVKDKKSVATEKIAALTNKILTEKEGKRELSPEEIQNLRRY